MQEDAPFGQDARHGYALRFDSQLQEDPVGPADMLREQVNKPVPAGTCKPRRRVLRDSPSGEA